VDGERFMVQKGICKDEPILGKGEKLEDE